MDRVLVTGGAGNIGAAVVRRLLRDPDFEVRVSDPLGAPAWMREGCEVHRGDLRVLAEARKAIAGCALVIHLAAMGDRPELPYTLTEVNAALHNAVSAPLSTRTSRASSTSARARCSSVRASSRPPSSTSRNARSRRRRAASPC